MPALLHRLRTFLPVSMIGWLIAVILLILYGYEDSFLKLNAIRSPFWDLIMPHYTHLGDGLLVSVLVAFFFARKDAALTGSMIIGMSLIGILVYLGKNWLFSEWHRPVMVFLHRIEFHEIPLRRLFHYTFPSGHSAAAGAAACFLAFATGMHAWPGILIALISMSAAYSRLYIGVHFLGDILVGHFGGVLCSCLVLWVFYPRIQKWLHLQGKNQQIKWEQRSWILVWTMLPISIGWIIYRFYL